MKKVSQYKFSIALLQTSLKKENKYFSTIVQYIWTVSFKYSYYILKRLGVQKKMQYLSKKNNNNKSKSEKKLKFSMQIKWNSIYKGFFSKKKIFFWRNANCLLLNILEIAFQKKLLKINQRIFFVLKEYIRFYLIDKSLVLKNFKIV